jgi:hypothetical protein
VDANLQYADRTSGWPALEHPWFFDRTWPGELIAALPFWPEGTGGTLAAAVRGDDDAHWAAYGRQLVAIGKPDLLTSLAWEFNGTWFEWSMRDQPALWAAAYRRVVQAVRSAAPNARFAWTMNAGSADPSPAWPGDDVVDVVATDFYDMWPASTDDVSWQQRITTPGGLEWAAAFARAHAKLLGVFEWGLTNPKDAGHGGDNPFYIRKMLDWFRSHAAMVYAELYFDATGGTRSRISPPSENPNGTAEYLAGLHP